MARNGRALGSDLVRQARADGERAAQKNQYDEWSFEGDDPVPYASLLRELETKAIAGEDERLAATLDQFQNAHHAETVRRATAQERAEEAVTQARTRMERHMRRRDESLTELDLLTGVHEPLPDADLDPRPPQPSRWIGPGDGTLAPPVPRWLKLPLVVLLVLVEVPIHFMTFKVFHPREPSLTWCLTIPVAACMVIGPHLTGVWLRRRLAVPPLGVVPVIASALLMLAWLGSSLVLASLRSTTLVTPPTVEGIEITGPVNSLNPTTLFAVFALVLVLSGLIAFLLGLADDHPAVAAFKAANRCAERAEDAYLRTINTHAGASIDRIPDASEVVAAAMAQHEHRVTAIRAEHAAAWAAYRDGWSLAVGNPSMTQAVGADDHQGMSV
jgi:hypothetical protein